jgi:hypothetical protein
MPPLSCYQEGHRIVEHQAVYCFVYWGCGTNLSNEWETTRPSIRCSFVLDLDIGAHLGAKPLNITEEWLLPTWRNEHSILYYNSGTDPFIS